MKASHKELYLNSLAQHAGRITTGKTNPVVVGIYPFFAQACDRAGLMHSYTPGDTRRIDDTFFDLLQKRLFKCGMAAFRTTREVLSLVGHGRVADINDDATPNAYKTSATPRSGNPLTAFAIFGDGCERQHPILGGMGPAIKALKTRSKNVARQCQPFGLPQPQLFMSDDRLN